MRAQFATTSWTQILAARDGTSSQASEALQNLCTAYWYPLYAFVRRQGHSPEESQDLTQAYFIQLLEKEYLHDFDPSLGRFRVFLKASMLHFLSKERDKARAWKHGGRATIVSFETEDGERRYCLEPVDRLTPESIYERRWALTLLERALTALRSEFAVGGRAETFELLKRFLTGEKPAPSYDDVAATLGMSETAVKTAVHRLRRRFGTLLRKEVTETVADPEEVDEELRQLLRAVAS